MKTILLITPFYPPNIGGVETSLYTLVTMLRRKLYRVKVISHKTARFFDRLEGHKILTALYLLPLLFIKSIWYMLFNNVNIIHGAGLMGGLVAKIIGFIWHRPYCVSTHAIYEGIYTLGRVEKAILGGAVAVFCLSEDSLKELNISNGVVYRTLIDPMLFRPMRTEKNDRFTVLFVARPLEKKGWKVVREVAKQMPDINFIVLTNISNNKLPYYYSLADLTITASQYKECFSRVILESLFCGTPVVYSELDVAVNTLDDGVAISVEPTTEGLRQGIIFAINRIRLNQHIKVENKCREYAMREFGNKNLEVFTDVYRCV